ncbi:hypothetical protein PMIN06_001822 [Paraphaeosphaeria minitans]
MTTNKKPPSSYAATMLMHTFIVVTLRVRSQRCLDLRRWRRPLLALCVLMGFQQLHVALHKSITASRLIIEFPVQPTVTEQTQMKTTLDVDTNRKLRAEAIHIEGERHLADFGQISVERERDNANIPKGEEVARLEIPMRHDEL